MKEMAADNTHQTAVEMLSAGKTAHVVDLPCGNGALAKRLLDSGYSNIVCGDINTDEILIKEMVRCVEVDLNRTTPFKTGEFDAVFCIECIEHLENPFNLMRELARILRTGGEIIISTPNILSTSSRSKFLSGGYFPHFAELACRWDEVVRSGYQAHIMPVSMTMLLYLAHINGLRLTDLRTNQFARRPRLKDKLVARIVKSVSRRFYEKPVYDLITSDTVLYGDILIFKFTK